MKYLSRIFMGKSESARLKLKDAYSWHKKLWQTFSADQKNERYFLFRLDDKSTFFQILLLSEEMPKTPSWGKWKTKSVSPEFLGMNSYRFQLKANPTFRRPSDRRRLGIYNESRLWEWINRKAQMSGFNIYDETLSISSPIDETFRKRGKLGKHTSVDFSGAMRVTDRTAFSKAFSSGIGSAKAFGYGLLMLQPIQL